MQFTLTNLFIACLATTALAAPYPKSKRQTSIGSFKAASKSRPSTVLENVDTLKEMSRVIAKFNFDINVPGLDGSTTVISVPDPLSAIEDTLSAIFDVQGSASTTQLLQTSTSKHDKHTKTAVGTSALLPTSIPAPSSVFVPSTSDAPASTIWSETSMPPTTDAPSSAATFSPAPTSTLESSISSETTVPTVSSVVPETTATPESTTSTTESSTETSTTISTSFATSFTFEPTSTEAAAAASSSSSTSTAATSTASQKEEATVAATPKDDIDSEYLSPVSIGGQTLNLDFDTGSADLWVFSTELSNTAGHNVFDSSKSSTWSAASGESWEISYGDGSSASGNVGYDHVVIGGATATSQAVELATAVADSFLEDTSNDGLLGLAFSSINTVKPTAQKTFFENIMEDLDQPLFTADLRTDASSTYEFGTIDASKYSGDIYYTAVDNSKGFWQFDSTSYTINGVTYTNSDASPAIADTGTSLILADSSAVAAYYAQVSGAAVNSTAGGYTFPCSATLPSFGVAIGDSGFTAVITGADNVYAKLDDTNCFGGIQSNSGIGYQVFGDVLLKQYFAIFNGGALTFGIANKAS